MILPVTLLGIGRRSTINSPIQVTSVHLTTSWQGNDPYTQSISIDNITANTIVDIQPNEQILSLMQDNHINAMWVENNNGSLTIKTMGGVFVAPITLQCTVANTEAV